MAARDYIESSQRHARSQQQAAEEPTAPAVRTTPLAHRPPQAAEEHRPEQLCLQAAPASGSSISFIVILLFCSHFLVLLGHPMPRIHTADDRARRRAVRASMNAVRDSVCPARDRALRQAVSESPPTSRSAPSSPGQTRWSASCDAAP